MTWTSLRLQPDELFAGGFRVLVRMLKPGRGIVV